MFLEDLRGKTILYVEMVLRCGKREPGEDACVVIAELQPEGDEEMLRAELEFTWEETFDALRLYAEVRTLYKIQQF